MAPTTAPARPPRRDRRPWPQLAPRSADVLHCHRLPAARQMGRRVAGSPYSYPGLSSPPGRAPTAPRRPPPCLQTRAHARPPPAPGLPVPRPAATRSARLTNPSPPRMPASGHHSVPGTPATPTAHLRPHHPARQGPRRCSTAPVAASLPGPPQIRPHARLRRWFAPACAPGTPAAAPAPAPPRPSPAAW